MAETTRSLTRGAALAACLLLVAAAVASAQAAPQPPVVNPPPTTPEFMARYDFHLSIAALTPPTITAPDGQSTSDQRFSWDTHFGGSLDVVDYVAGRTAILIDYQAVLGSEYRPFDPNQGNYTLEVSSSARMGGRTEVAGVFHHVSRHLSDRPKREAVLARTPITRTVGAFAHASGQVFGVDGTVPGRGTQYGGSFEAGFRIHGSAGAMELFAGIEKRVDADPLDRQPHHWALAGFRLLGR